LDFFSNGFLTTIVDCFLVLQGNAEFKSEGDKTRLANSATLSTVASLLCVDPNELNRALCHRVIAANGELMEKGHTTSEAIYGRDAFAKVLALHLICRKVITK
jgi:myosin heavy subunit